MSFHISILVSGPGTDPRHRSHWAFSIHRDDEEFGEILNVQVIDLQRLWYQYEERTGEPGQKHRCEGRIKIATLTDTQRLMAKKVISGEPAPRDGKRRCQDWILDATISLEADGVVESGTSEYIQRLVGKPAAEVAKIVGGKWVPAK